MTAEILRRAAERMRADAERCGDKASDFVPAVADMVHEVSCAHYPLRADERHEPYGCATCFPSDGHWPCSVYDEALSVARAYLGES